MWSFDSVATIEQQWGAWYALVTLQRDGVPESAYVHFGAQQPSEAAAQQAGVELALKRSLDEAYQAGDSIPCGDFLERFTNAEIARIYAAASQSPDVFAYIKKMELNATINRHHPDVAAGLDLLEQAGLLDYAGRAAEILAFR